MTQQPLRHFLIVFDHRQGRIIRDASFDDVNEAVTVYSKTEREYTANSMVEVVLIGSDSIETVRRTHANYFDGTAALEKYLIGL